MRSAPQIAMLCVFMSCPEHVLYAPMSAICQWARGLPDNLHQPNAPRLMAVSDQRRKGRARPPPCPCGSLSHPRLKISIWKYRRRLTMSASEIGIQLTTPRVRSPATLTPSEYSFSHGTPSRVHESLEPIVASHEDSSYRFPAFNPTVDVRPIMRWQKHIVSMTSQIHMQDSVVDK
jgi:hypothetical protein